MNFFTGVDSILDQLGSWTSVSNSTKRNLINDILSSHMSRCGWKRYIDILEYRDITYGIMKMFGIETGIFEFLCKHSSRSIIYKYKVNYTSLMRFRTRPLCLYYWALKEHVPRNIAYKIVNLVSAALFRNNRTGAYLKMKRKRN